jgi:ATP-dependent metalloprotease
MVMELGMSELVGDVNVSEGYRHLSPKTKELVEKEVRRILDESRGRATNILTTYRKELDLLANALMEYESLNLEEMRKVIAGEKLTDKLKILPNAPIKIPEGVFGGSKLEGGSAGGVKTGENGVSASPQ